jgi:hypothetical protein
MKILAMLLILRVLAPASLPQAKPTPTKNAEPDRLGLTCAQILQMTSTAWIAQSKEKAAKANDSPEQVDVRAINAYGKCYDARTTHLATTLGKSGRGPLMGARGNFGDFENALKNFATKALAAADPPPGPEKSAYAALYEKQFRYQFYEAYDQRETHPRPLTAEESAEFSKAKNRFGEFLGLLPDDRMHEIHAAFSQIFDAGPVSDVSKLELYRYAIFLFESPKDTSFSSPPF